MLALAPDGKSAAVGEYTHTAKFWDMLRAAYSPDGRIVAWGDAKAGLAVAVVFQRDLPFFI
jgi:hypothetical protein